MLLGEAGLVPILEVGAAASAVGWMSACASYYCMKPAFRGRIAAMFGLLITSAMIFVKVVPIVPGHFSRYEWMALAIWLGVGLVLNSSGRHENTSVKRQSEISNVARETQTSES
jgi:hypothetical protein